MFTRLYADSDVILKVRPPEDGEADLMREGGWLIGFIWPAPESRDARPSRERKATVFAMDCVPRITRAQKMDTLSAMANIAGYRAVIEAANHFPDSSPARSPPPAASTRQKFW